MLSDSLITYYCGVPMLPTGETVETLQTANFN